MTRQISQIEGFNTAINTFYIQYDAYPGDMNYAETIWGQAASGAGCLTTAGTGTQTCNGDGSNFLSYVGASDTSDVESEPYRFWQHLANAGMISGSYSGISDAGTCGGTNYCATADYNVPAGIFDGSIIMAASLRTTASRSWVGRVNNDGRSFFALTNPNNHYQGNWYGGAITTQQIYFMDTKLDDGVPFTGRITEISGTSHWLTPTCTAGGLDSRTDLNATYDLNASGLLCMPIIDMTAM